MALKVTGVSASGPTGVAILTAYEKGVDDFEVVTVDTSKGEHTAPGYLLKQPFGLIPFIEDGDVTLFESRAIVRYLSDKYADQCTDLYPKAAAKRALVDQWMEIQAHWHGPPAGMIARERWYAPRFLGRPVDEAVVAENKKKLDAVLDIYDAHLAKNKYFCGDDFSLADIMHMPLTNYLKFGAPGDFAELMNSRKHVVAWWDNVSSRPSWKKYEVLVWEFVAKAQQN